MSQSTRNIRARLTLQTEGEAQAIAAIDRVSGAIERVEDPLGDLGISAAGGVRRLRSEFGSAEFDVEQLRLETVDLIDTLNRLDSVSVTPTIDVQRRGAGGSSTFAGGLESLDRAGSVGSQILGGLNQSEAANAAGLVGDLAGAFTSLNPAMLAVTAAGAGIALVLGDVQARFEAGREAALRYVALQGDVNQMILEGATRSDIQGVIDDQERLLNSRRDERDFLQGVIDENQRILDQFGGGRAALASPEAREQLDALFATLSERTGGLVTTIPAAEAAIAAFNTEIEALGPEILVNKNALDSEAVAQNDAAAAAEAAAEAVAVQSDKTKELALAQAAAADAAREEAEALQATISEKQKRIALDQAEAEQQRRELAQEGLTDAVDNLFAARVDLAEASNKLAAAEDALAQSETTHIQRIDAITAESEDKRSKALDKALDAREDAERDHLQEVAEINRRESLSVKGAVRERNVTAAIQAQERADEERRKEKIAGDRRLDAVQDSLDEQLDSIEDNARRAVRAEEQRARDEQTIRRHAVEVARVEKVNAANAEVALDKAVHVAQQNANAAHYTALLGVHEKGMSAVTALVAAKYDQVLGRLSGGAGGKTLAGGTGQGAFSAGQAFAFLQNTGIPTSGSKPLTINVNGMTRLGVVRTINTTLRQIWED